jgi:hypothetical protein
LREYTFENRFYAFAPDYFLSETGLIAGSAIIGVNTWSQLQQVAENNLAIQLFVEDTMKKILILVSFLLLIILGVAAFALTQTYQPTTAVSAQGADEPGKHEKVIEIAVEKNVNGEITSGEVTITFDDPEILPVDRESAFGVFLGRDGDVLTLGTGSIEVEIGVEVVNDKDPVTTVNVSHSGDPVEVVVTEDTIIYKDTTERPEVSSEDIETGRKVIARTVEPGSLDEVGESMILRVWGETHDGRLIADLLVYEQIQ